MEFPKSKNFLDGQIFEGKLYLARIVESNADSLTKKVTDINEELKEQFHFYRFVEKENDSIDIYIYQVLEGTIDIKRHQFNFVVGP